MSNEYVNVWVYDKMLDRVQTRHELIEDAAKVIIDNTYYAPNVLIYDGCMLIAPLNQLFDYYWEKLKTFAEIANNTGDYTKFGGPDKSDKVMKAIARKFESRL